MRWILLLLSLFAIGCHKHEYRLPRSRPEPIAIAPAQDYSERTRASGEKPTASEIQLSGPLEGAPAARRDSGPLGDIGGEIELASRAVGGAFAGQANAAAPPATPNPIEVSKPVASAEMIDVEARVELEVADIERASTRIRAIVSEAGGKVVNEVVENKSSSAGAALSLRVPTTKVHAVLAALGSAGKLLSRKIESKDIGREYHDASIVLSNLEATLKRYEELLSKAQAPPQVLEIEKELARVRTQLDRVKGDMRWMRDRATMATIYVSLTAPEPDASVVEPSASLYPGLRATSLVDFSDDSRAYLGGGVSVRIVRAFSIDADWMTRARNGDGVDAFVATAGGELYSDLLGGGRRRFLNPYLGLRAGYARIRGDGALALGGVLGVELWKTKSLTIEIDGRGYGLIGVDETTHAALQTTLGLNFAY